MVSLQKFLTAVLLWALLALPAGAADKMRIVSLYPGHSDNIVAMGGGDRLVALSTADDADLLPGLPRLSPKAASEKVLALKPDLVLVRGLNRRLNPTLLEQLEKLGVAVVEIEPPNWDGFGDYLKNLASVVGGLDGAAAAARAEKLRAEIFAAAEKARAGRAGPRVFFEATAKELHTCAPGSWAARLVQCAGGVNVAAAAVPLRQGSPLAAWGRERLLQAAGESLDVYLLQQGAMDRRGVDELKALPWFGSLKNVSVVALPESWLSRPSLRGLERGGRALVQAFYGAR